MIKMIVVDLDGTLLNKNGKVSENTKEYLKKLKNKGYTIVIATGRMYASALDATDKAEFANYIITDTGACIYDAINAKIISKNTINKDTLKKVFKYYNDECRAICICNRDTIYSYSDENASSILVKTTKDKEYILNNCQDVSHFIIEMKNNGNITNLYNALLKEITELNIIIMQNSYSGNQWIEAFPKRCSKYNAIKKLADKLNILNEDIMAFGDGLNDIDMLEKCGHGIALQNALPEVKEAADEITFYDHNHDGVINYLKKYLDID